MASDASAVLKRVKDEKVEFVRFWFTDIFGQLKSFAIGKDELEDAFADGMGFDGSSITGFNRIEESDMIAMPDPDTFAALGHWGQALYVIPSEKLVIVRYADDRDGSYRHNELLKRVLKAVQP